MRSVHQEENEESPEYGTEYAAFGPGPGSQAHGPQPTQTSEGAVFVQLQGEEGALTGHVTPGSGAPLCKAGMERRPCLRYVQGCYGPSRGCGNPKRHRTPYHNKEPSAQPRPRPSGHSGRSKSSCRRDSIISYVGGSAVSVLFPPATPVAILVGGVVTLECA